MEFLEWFKDSTKFKRWILLIIIGVSIMCYSTAKIITLNVIEPMTVIFSVLEFIVGLGIVIWGILGIQKRTLEIFIEANRSK